MGNPYKKIAIVSDIHFGSYPGLSTVTACGNTSRLEDIRKAMLWALEESKKLGCEAAVFCGDVFENRETIDITVLDTCVRTVWEWARVMPVYVLPGNHDSALRSPRKNSTQALHGIAKVIDVAAYVPELQAVVVPWDDNPENMAEDIDRVRKANPKAKVLYTHLLLEGKHAGGGNGASVKLLQADKFQRVFVGDVHDPVDLSSRIHYIGALLQIDFRDAGKQRGFAVYDYPSNKFTRIENTLSPRFHLVATSIVPTIQKQDLVRIKGGDVSVEAITKIRKMATWVEGVLPPANTDASVVRIAFDRNDGEDDTWRKYVEHKASDDKNMTAEDIEELVNLGVSILERVSG
jgi:DNA repair exonuclease SbcCD nuclease subunit